ncbi:hypothetical protein HanRHA438_Chr13g0585291 [Helianthus annuus]|nr:hypothetical protein HanRHA438_Chr13g0585291 [Helianthus annuus]
MIYKSLSASSDFSKILWMSSPPICPCEKPISFSGRKDFRRRNRGVILGCMVPFDGRNQSVSIDIANSVKRGFENVFSENFELRNPNNEDSDSIQLGYSNEFSGFREDPVIGKLTTQLGVIHPIPLPPINKNIGGMFVSVFH